MTIQDVLAIGNLIMLAINLMIFVVSGWRYLHKPQDAMKAEIKAIKEKFVEVEKKIEKLYEIIANIQTKDEEQDEALAIFSKCQLAFTHFEIAYCIHTGYEHNEELLEAKKALEEYLTGTKHEAKNRN